jgi:tRNA A-37 threonylcarbamoyl transferase component Bud32
MNENEGNLPKCPRCGASLPANAPEGLCPRCVVAANMSAETDMNTGEAGPGGTIVVKPAPAPPPPPEEIAKLFPQLEILETLGRGGMGAVYKARQPRLDRVVALKILSPERKGDPQFAERFEREARTLARLHHPNIVAIYDFGEVQGNFYLLMEYVDGLTLRQLLQTRKLTPEEALVIVPKICEALQYAHQQAVVHRDIKPENILLDKQGRVKIADFGIAKIVGQQGQTGLTAEQQIIGTPHYMAPEQVERPKTVDHRADIYSLGVVLYEMLTSELPLGKFAPPSRKVQVDVRLDEVVLRALEKEPDRRYQQAQQVKTDMETISSGSTKPLQSAFGAASAAPNGSDKKILPALLLAFFFGVFGAHRFYVGKILSGFLQLGALAACVLMIILCATTEGRFQPTLGILLGFSIVGCGVMATIDWILIACGAFTDGHGRKITYGVHPKTSIPPGGDVRAHTSPGTPPVFGAAPANPAIDPQLQSAATASSSKSVAWPWVLGGAAVVIALFVAGAFLVSLWFAGRPFVATAASHSSGADDSSLIEIADNSDLASEAVAPEVNDNSIPLPPGYSTNIPLPPGYSAEVKRVIRSGAAASFSKIFSVAPGGKLTMKVDRGEIRVSGSDANTIEVRVTREVTRARSDDAKKLIKEHQIELRQNGKEISITAEPPPSLRNNSLWGLLRTPNLNVRYDIIVPRTCDVRLDTAGGDVNVSDLTASLKAETMGGNLDFNVIGGTVDGQTMGGNIRAVECKSDLVLKTFGGNVRVEEFSGSFVRASTQGGEISADFAAAPKADCDLHTSGGTVTVKLPELAAITLDAQTLGGSVNSQLPVQTEGKHQGSSLHGKINGGGPLLKLQTMGGDINVTKR